MVLLSLLLSLLMLMWLMSSSSVFCSAAEDASSLVCSKIKRYTFTKIIRGFEDQSVFVLKWCKGRTVDNLAVVAADVVTTTISTIVI